MIDYTKVKESMGTNLVIFPWSWTEKVQDGNDIKHNEEWKLGSLGTEYYPEVMGIVESIGPVFTKMEEERIRLVKENLSEEEIEAKLAVLQKGAGMAFMKKENIKLLNTLIFETLHKFEPDVPEEVLDKIVLDNFMALATLVIQLNTPKSNETPDDIKSKVMELRNKSK